MSIRRHLTVSVLAVGAVLVVAGGLRAQQAPAAKPPSIIFFLVDDQRNDTLGCAGHPIIRTPTVDSLARRGTRFANMFVTTSICAASRASFLTGLFERTHGYTFGTPPISAEHARASYPALLRQAGYRTGFIGKYGVGVAGNGTKEMFDSFCPQGPGRYFYKQPDGTLRHETDLATDKALAFLADQPADKPFCLSVSFNAAHANDGDKRPGVGHYPWPQGVDGMYDDITIPPPRLGDPKIYESQPDILKKSFNRERWFWRWDTPEKYQVNMRAYFRMISGIDRAIARVLEELDKRKLADNTVIIYAGDNGYYMGNRGFAGKWSHYEESLRVPLVIYDPRDGVRRDQVSQSMALNIDVPATMLDLAGVAVPKHYQGRSLVPLLRGQTPGDWRTDFFCEHLMDVGEKIPKWEGVRNQRYKYARYFESGYEALQDLKSDPDELKNFAGDPACADVLAALRKRCDELRDAYGGPYKPRPRPAAKKK